jgi:hypothetical protein
MAVYGKDHVEVEVEVEPVATDNELHALLDARRFDFLNPPPPTVPIYTLREMAIATAGNITVPSAQVKAGKTSLVAAMMAAAINPEADENMTLGIRSPGAGGRAVIHFDCEQSPDDHHAVICNTMRRAGLGKPPAALRSYCLTDLRAAHRRAALHAELARAGDVFAVFLDGVADLTFSVNDEAEAIAFTDELHALAIEYQCAMITVLHENPGSEIGKTRGHLGSQLERKQFAGLRLSKDADEITTLWTDRSRKASIPKSQGIRFAYDKEAGLHLPVATANDARSEAARDELAVFAADIFRTAPKAGLAWGELINRIKDKAGLKIAGARKRQEKMIALGIIQKNLWQNWELTTA